MLTVVATAIASARLVATTGLALLVVLVRFVACTWTQVENTESV